MLTEDRAITDNLYKAVISLSEVLMKAGKYIKHDDMWCPISREHRDATLQAHHVAAASKAGKTEEPKAAPEKTKRESPQEWQHRKFQERHTPKKYNNEHESTVDKKIAETHQAYSSAKLTLDRESDQIRRAAGDRQQGRPPRWGMSFQDAFTKVKEGPDMTRGGTWKQSILDSFEKARSGVDEAREAYKEAEKKYEGWSRFFLVNNVNGHIHSSMNCPTCKMDTTFSWLPDISGLEEKDAVDAHGPRLCSHCFPSAPAEWTKGVEKDRSDLCDMSGQYHDGKWSDRSARCPGCGAHVSLTRGNAGNKYRSHKPLTEDEKRLSTAITDKYDADSLDWRLKRAGGSATVRIADKIGKKKVYEIDVVEPDGRKHTISTRSALREYKAPPAKE